MGVGVGVGNATVDKAAIRRPQGWRREASTFVELLALTGFAVAQPLLDIFGRAPTQFVFREAQRADIVAFGLIVTFVLPLALVMAEMAVGLVWPFGRRLLHFVFTGGLVAAFAVQALRSTVTGVPLFILAGLLGAGGAALCDRARAAQLWLRFASVAPIAFLALFLFASDTALLLKDDAKPPVEVKIGTPAPVVMLVFDEFPLASIMASDGTIDPLLYPNLAAFAGQSNWFRNTTAVSSSTWYAVPAVATGQFPKNGTTPVAASHPESLFRLLGGSYDLDVTESITRLCAPELCATEAPAVSGRNELLRDAAKVMRDRLSLSGAAGDATADMVEEPAAEGTTPTTAAKDPAAKDDDFFADFRLNQPDRFRTFLDGVATGSQALHYLHVLLPHVPYRFLPSGARYVAPDPDLGREDDQWADEPWFPTLSRQRLQLQLAYVDTLVGELVRTLKEAGAFDRSLIVMTADHGVSFHPGLGIRGIEGQAISRETIGELAWVPLFVKTPNQKEGVVSDANVLTVDVVPTIADVLDVTVPWAMDGQSVFGPERSDNIKPFYRSDVNPFGVDSLDPVDIDGDAGWESLTANAVDKFLPNGKGRERFWRIGADSDLVGTRPSASPSRALTKVDFTLRDPATYALTKTSPTVPSLVRGSLSAALRGERLAIAVNGVIGAVGPAYTTDQGADFAVMVDDQLFKQGTNAITLYRLAN